MVRSNLSRSRIALAVVVAALLLPVGVAAADATGATHSNGGQTVEVAPQDINIEGLNLEVSDVHVTGTGLANVDIDHRSYTIHDATLQTNGFTVAWNDTQYEFSQVTVTINDVGVTVEDVTIQ